MHCLNRMPTTLFQQALKTMPPTSDKTISTKMFTENWLQALTLAVQSPAARLIKPHMTDIDNVSQARDEAIQTESAQRLWSYCQESGLVELLRLAPTAQSQWRFDGDEMFTFELSDAANQKVNDLESWSQSLGLVAGDFKLTATTTASEWAGLVRKEAVRQRRSSSADTGDGGMTLQLECTATWDREAWKVRFEKADWIERKFDEAFETDRPDLNETIEKLISAIISGEQNLLPKSLPHTTIASDRSWIQSVPSLVALHQSVMENKKLETKLWFRKTWGAVWPVIYREQNRLDQPCELSVLRRELADCFAHAPKLTVWMFVAAKLLCVAYLGRGLGICGNFRR